MGMAGPARFELAISKATSIWWLQSGLGGLCPILARPRARILRYVFKVIQFQLGKVNAFVV